MRSTLLKTVLRARTDFDELEARQPMRRRADRAASGFASRSQGERRSVSEGRLVLYFFSVLMCTALGVILEEMRMVGGAWSLFIVGAAFLLAALRALFSPPGNARKRRPNWR